MSYDDASDFEVNSELTRLVNNLGDDFKLKIGSGMRESFLISVKDKSEEYCEITDYCNNWTDTGQLIDDHDIELKKTGCEMFWYAQFGVHHSGFHANSKRVIAICAIIILENK